MKHYPLTKKITEQARLLALAGEPTRMRMLCVLVDCPGACVHQIAESVHIPIALASHHLQAMKEQGLVECERSGQTMCYRIVPNDFVKKLKPILCDCK